MLSCVLQLAGPQWAPVPAKSSTKKCPKTRWGHAYVSYKLEKHCHQILFTTSTSCRHERKWWDIMVWNAASRTVVVLIFFNCLRPRIVLCYFLDPSRSRFCNHFLVDCFSLVLRAAGTVRSGWGSTKAFASKARHDTRWISDCVQNGCHCSASAGHMWCHWVVPNSPRGKEQYYIQTYFADALSAGASFGVARFCSYDSWPKAMWIRLRISMGDFAQMNVVSLKCTQTGKPKDSMCGWQEPGPTIIDQILFTNIWGLSSSCGLKPEAAMLLLRHSDAPFPRSNRFDGGNV